MLDFIQKILKDKFLVALVIIGSMIAIGAIWCLTQPSELERYFASGNGRIEATEVDVATKLGGRVTDIFVNEGDFVKTGQVLAQMQIDVLEAQHDEAQAQYRQAVNAAQSLDAQVAVRVSDLVAAQAKIVQCESELDAAKRRFTRSQTLSKEGAVSMQVLDDDRAAMRGKLATVNAAKAQAAAAEATILAAKAQLVSSQSTVEAIAATIKRIEVEITDSKLKSPRDGRVQYRIVQPGEVLSAGGKVLNVVDLSDVYMTFFLPETVVGKVALGSEVRIILDAIPEYAIPAKVSFIASTAQFTPKTVETASERQKLMFRVKARINPELLLQNITQIKTGLPGVAWVKLDPKIAWPAKLKGQASK